MKTRSRENGVGTRGLVSWRQIAPFKRHLKSDSSKNDSSIKLGFVMSFTIGSIFDSVCATTRL